MKKRQLISILLCTGSMLLAACGAKGGDQASSTSDESSAAKPDYKVGSIIEFGKYEQDGDTTNGAEPIKWKIKAKTENTITILSEFGLDVVQYNEEFTAVTWDASTIRTWMNGEFYSSAFSEAEKTKIVKTARDNKAGSDTHAKDGKPTEDNVWLLSFDEAQQYFYNKDTKRYALECKPTAYAISKGAYVSGDGYTRWWLSTSANDGSVDEASKDFITKTVSKIVIKFLEVVDINVKNICDITID